MSDQIPKSWDRETVNLYIDIDRYPSLRKIQISNSAGEYIVVMLDDLSKIKICGRVYDLYPAKFENPWEQI